MKKQIIRNVLLIRELEKYTSLRKNYFANWKRKVPEMPFDNEGYGGNPAIRLC